MKVAMLASEVVPFAKTGGLADVVGALPKTLSRLGLEVNVFLPLYRETKKKNLELHRVVEDLESIGAGKNRAFPFGNQGRGRSAFCSSRKTSISTASAFTEPPRRLSRQWRALCLLSRAALETLRYLGFRPDVVHAHDWQAAVALAMLKFLYGQDPFFAYTKSLFTIHNLAYQGLFERGVLGRIGLPEGLFKMEDLEFYGQVNYLKGGILYSTAVNTVSERYSQEIQTPEFGYRLDGLLRKRRDHLFGILNGVDYADWNPATDRFILRPYDPTYLDGKKECKRDLLLAFGLEKAKPEAPVVGMVSRLAGQKGFDILCESLECISGWGPPSSSWAREKRCSTKP